jgi:hypothetical protein
LGKPKTFHHHNIIPEGDDDGATEVGNDVGSGVGDDVVIAAMFGKMMQDPKINSFALKEIKK